MASPPQPEFVYSAIVTLQARVDHGPSPVGHRYRVPITGGTFEGPEIRGRVVPGGADWQLLRGDGVLTIEADYYIETDDGVQIHVRNCGLVRAGVYAMTTPVFEAPDGRYAWLNQNVFCGTLEPGEGPDPTVRLQIYRLI